MSYPARELLEGRRQTARLVVCLDPKRFALSVSSTLELPDTDCKQSAPGSGSGGTPLGHGAEGNWGRHAVLARIDKGVKRH